MQAMAFDVLVIGGGGAGLRAALAARELLPSDRKVAIATKGKLGESGVTATACSDRMAFHATLPYTPPGGKDNWRQHADDIYYIGGKVSDYNLAAILARESKTAFQFLDELGVPFVKTPDGRAKQFITDGSEYPRACYTGPYTANHIEKALLKALEQTDAIVIDDCMLLDLILEDGRCRGALCLVGKPGREIPTVIAAGAVVLATGGAGAIYLHNVFPGEQTGDGYAAAWRAGAELVNMEFMQIALCSAKTKLACSGSIMRSIPRFVNGRGEEFLPKYFPQDYALMDIYAAIFRKGATWPASREKDTHLIDVGVYKEMQEAGPIYLDFSRNPEGFEFSLLPLELKERYQEEIHSECSPHLRTLSPAHRFQELNPDSVEWLKKRGIDVMAGDLLEIVPAIQHFQGGVKIDESAATRVPGLFAAGEVAGGQHGANRPGGNSLLDTQVFGKIAGQAAANYAMEVKPEVELLDLSEMVRRWHLVTTENKEGTPSVKEIRQRIQETMYTAAALVRTEAGLKNALENVRMLKDALVAPDDSGLIYWAETVNMADVAVAVLTAALLRDESRGPHLRFVQAEDLMAIPPDEARWQKYIVLTLQNGEIEVAIRSPIRPDDTF